MKALVVYESMFGNTRDIASAIAEGLGDGTATKSIDEVGRDDLLDVDLVVVGGPTHAHGMSRPQTRQSAGEDGGTSVESGIRERLTELGAQQVNAAAFDTRIAKPRVLTGSAAKGIDRLLHGNGYRVVAPPESFLVDGTKGPLLPGEHDRAKAWGESLRSMMTPARAS